jgi:hypothetical protein
MIVFGTKIPNAFVSAAQGDNWYTAGNQFLRTFQVLVQATVINLTTSAPPALPNNGDTYIVGSSPTGFWSNQTNNIAFWSLNNPAVPGGEWEFNTPSIGWIVGNQADGNAYIFGSTGWNVVGVSTNPTFTGTASFQNLTASGTLGVFNGVGTSGQVLSSTGSGLKWISLAASSGGTVTSIATSGIATGGPITSAGTITVLGSGNSTTAATASTNVATAPQYSIMMGDGSGNITSSGTLVTNLAPKASPTLSNPTFTGTVTIPNAIYNISISGNAATATSANGVNGIIGIINGGTGASTAATALTNLGAAALSGAIFTGTVIIPVALVTTFTGTPSFTNLTISNNIGGNPQFTGIATMSSTVAQADNSTTLATTAFVKSQNYAVTGSGGHFFQAGSTTTGSATFPISYASTPYITIGNFSGSANIQSVSATGATFGLSSGGQTINWITMGVQATWTISGTITGAGANSATVTLSGAASAVVTTAATGAATYSFTGLYNGSYTVTPTKTGHTYTPTSASIFLTNASVTQNFTSV